MTLDTESQHKESLDVFIRSLQAAPDSLIKSLTGKEFARHIHRRRKGNRAVHLFSGREKEITFCRQIVDNFV